MRNNPFLAFGYVLLGVGMIKEAAAAMRPASLAGLGHSPSSLGDVGEPLPGEDDIAQRELQRGSRALSDIGFTKGKLHTVANIDERVSYIKKAIEKGALHPVVRSAAVAVLSRKCQWRGGVRWCTTPKDYKAEVATLFKAVQDAASSLAQRYVRDHAKVDQFPAAAKLVRFVRGDDCDGGVIKLASLFISVGYPVRLIVMQSTRASSWDHILLEVGIPPGNPQEWIVLDWSVYPFRAPGWEPPGMSEARRTGRPAGMVARVKVYPV